MARSSVRRDVRPEVEKNDPEEPVNHALGRSRGGLSTKIHLLCDEHGHPLHFHLTPGQAHESTAVKALLDGAEERVVDHDAYRDRNIIERLIGWLKESRRIFSRFEKTAKNYRGMLKLAFIRRYLRILC